MCICCITHALNKAKPFLKYLFLHRHPRNAINCVKELLFQIFFTKVHKKSWDTAKHMKATSILTTKKHELTTNNFDY